MRKTIGVLAVQGAFIEHIYALQKLGVNTFEIRQKADLEKQPFDGLILPGGESTVMGKLLNELDMFEILKEKIFSGIPVFGTCAGVILLAKDIANDPNTYFGAMDITVERNAYGRQLGSFQTFENFADLGKVPMTFIRAPKITKVSGSTDILAVVNGDIVAARQNNLLATTFHPELADNPVIHKYFLDTFFKELQKG